VAYLSRIVARGEKFEVRTPSASTHSRNYPGHFRGRKRVSRQQGTSGCIDSCMGATMLLVCGLIVSAFAAPLTRPPLFLRVTESAANLFTNVYRYEYLSGESPPRALVTLSLYSMLHVADSAYYKEVESRTDEEHEVVLYELITDISNTDSVAGGPLRRLARPIASPAAESLAAKFSLQTQLSLPLQERPNWFIADLDAETVRSLEAPRAPLVRLAYWGSQITGRTGAAPVLPKFFLSDTTFFTALRLLSWLAVPCPELTVLLLDWSRARRGGTGPGNGDRGEASTRAKPNNRDSGVGGLPSAVIPVLKLASVGQLDLARKLAFAQTLVSGVPDSGSWGGEARSDVEVRVRSRNKECIKCIEWVLLKGLEDVRARSAVPGPGSGSGSEGRLWKQPPPDRPLSIAVLYGVYHIGDLHTRLKRLGFKLQQQQQQKESKGESEALRAWEINLTTGQAVSFGGAALLGTAAAAYLVLGTLDWLLLLRLGLQTVLSGGADSVLGQGDAELSSAVDWGFMAVYAILYYQRHAMVLRAVSNVGVAWDRGLFEQ